MWARARSQSGFTTIELLLAVMVGSVGIISMIGTFDVSRRVTSFSEMKEAAAHVAEQKMEELRAMPYGDLALNGDPVPSGSTDEQDPAYHLGVDGTGAKTYRWSQDEDAAAGHTEPLVIDPVDGKVAATAESWTDGRTKGKIHRYVTCAAATIEECDQGPDTSAFKRITVAVTVENALGPQNPMIVSTIVGNPETANTAGPNPLDSPNTQCADDEGNLVDCVQGVEGTVRTWYLYDTPATESVRQEISGSHPTHPTVAATGTCASGGTSGCPVPDLMGMAPPPAPTVTPPIYNYSNEITGGSTPGGAVIRRDAECGGSLTTTDNTKGHLWVSAPVAAPVNLTGDAAMSISTQTFNGVTAAAMVCVGFYNVPGDISNLVDNPPTRLGSAGHSLTSWPRVPTSLGFALPFLESGAEDVTIPAGNRLGVRVWTAASSAADLVFVYDHPMHASFVQVNEAD